MRARRITSGLFAAMVFAASTVTAHYTVSLTADEEARYLGIWHGASFRRAEPWRMDLFNAVVPSVPLVFGLDVQEIPSPQLAALTQDQEILPGCAVPITSILRAGVGTEDAGWVGPLVIDDAARWPFNLTNTPAADEGWPVIVLIRRP